MNQSRYDFEDYNSELFPAFNMARTVDKLIEERGIEAPLPTPPGSRGRRA